MNVFATLKTVFFGSKFLSSPVPIDGTPRRDLVSALNGLMPLCRTIPGVRLALDIREGQVVLALNWTPRTDGNASTGSYHYIVSDEEGVREMADSQVLLTENGKDNLPGSMDDSRIHPIVSTEKTEKDSAHLKKDVQKKAGPTSPEDTGKKAKSHTLMQEVTAFLTSRYRFRFNVLTEETEVASVEKYYKEIVDKYNSTEIKNNYETTNERLKYWYVDSQYNNLYCLKESILSCVQEEKYKELFLCIFSSILKATSKWLTKSIKPQVDPKKEIHDVMYTFEKQYKVFLKAIKQINYKKDTKVEIECKNILEVEKREYVDLIITSPPYVTSYEYADLHQLSTLWLDYTTDYKELRKDSIGSLYNSSKKVYTYLSEFEKHIVEKMQVNAPYQVP